MLTQSKPYCKILGRVQLHSLRTAAPARIARFMCLYIKSALNAPYVGVNSNSSQLVFCRAPVNTRWFSKSAYTRKSRCKRTGERGAHIEE